MLACNKCFKVNKSTKYSIHSWGTDLKCTQPECGGDIVEIDDLIYDTVRILNEKGYKTKFCCSGHTVPYLNIYEEDVYIVFENNIFESEDVVSLFDKISSNKFNRDNNAIHSIRIPFNDVYEFRYHLNELNLLLLKFAIELKPISGYIKKNIVVPKHIEYFPDGSEKIYEYDSKGNCIHFKRRCYEGWYEYDEKNNLIHTKDSNKFEEWYQYNENNKLTYYKNSDGFEYCHKYDHDGNLIH